MTESVQLIEALDARVKRRDERREFFRTALGAAAFTAAGAAALTMPGRAAAQSAPTEADVLNFALNLEYLEAQFYSYAATGNGLDQSLLSGSTSGGAQGAVRGGRKAVLSDPLVIAYANEIAADEIAHVKFLRTALGSSAVAQPVIDVSVGANSAFSNAARAAGLIRAGETFDPYASDNNFLLGAFIFEDVGVTAYKGASPLLINAKTTLQAAAGILAVEAYHAGLVRTALYRRGVALPADAGVPSSQLVGATEAISNARDSLDGSTDLDQGIATRTETVTTTAGANQTVTTSNLVPVPFSTPGAPSNGIAFSRSPAQVLSIVYLNSSATAGGFFPNGVNGTVKQSGTS